MRTSIRRHRSKHAAGGSRPSARKRITLGLILAVLLILIGVLVNNIVVPRTWAGAPLIFPLGIDTNAGLDTPSSDDEPIHSANVDLGRLLIGSNATVYCMNDFVPDPIYDSADASEADTPDLALLQLAVTIPTTLPFIHGPSDNNGWIYNFADNFAGNQTGSYDTAHPGQGETSGAGGAGSGPGAPNDGPSEKKGTPKSPSTGTETGQPDNGAYGYTPGFPSNLVFYGGQYHVFTPDGGPPGITPPNPAGTNGDHVWLGDPPPPNTFNIASQDSGDPNSPQGNGPQGTSGNGDHHDNDGHHDGGGTPQTVQTFSLTDDPQSPPLTPTPEPATFSILGIGLVALGLVRRRASAIRD